MIAPDPSGISAEVLSHRPRLLGLAYRMLGDAQEAEDIVQEAYLRWLRIDPATVQSPEAWLVTVVSRLALDRLRRSATERAAYAGPWLPAPVATPSPDAGAERASDLSIALLMLLERLAPEERAAFLLRDVFDTGYAEIAHALGRSEAAVRQMVHRARERVRAGRPRFAPPPEARERLLHRFLQALADDDRDGVLALLAPDVTFTTDGGGKVPAARNVVSGADRVCRFVLGLERKYGGRTGHRVAPVNGHPALLTFWEGRLLAVTELAMDGERIVAFYRVMNPDKLRHAADSAPEIE
ncbi:MAG TPA: RNA polymerase sigma factor SigJ [Longimicrobium sp.]|jgi:RNA polymerase sigma-70 factor (ECF subfamily)